MKLIVKNGLLSVSEISYSIWMGNQLNYFINPKNRQMATRRDIWPNYKDRGGNPIPKPRYQSNFPDSLTKIRKIKDRHAKPKKKKKRAPAIPAYPLPELLKNWLLFLVFTTLTVWTILYFIIN
jgi:hypothetical protein